VDEIDKASKTRRMRKRVYNNDEFAPGEESAPKNTPYWTRSGYNGFLKTSVKNHINEDSEGQERNKSSSSSSEEEMEYE
jgi:hypothetical protein